MTTQGVLQEVDSVDVCAREGSISKISGDGTGGWFNSIYDCCLASNVITWNYKTTFGPGCVLGSLVEVCTDNLDICLSTVIYSSDGIGCIGGAMAAGYYADFNYSINGNKRYWNGTSWGTICVDCGTACLVEGTEITLSDGTTKLIQDIQVNDALKSIDVQGMPEYSYQWPYWSSVTLSYFDTTVRVISITPSVAGSVTNINNGRLIATNTHNHVVKQDGVWYIRTTSELSVGNILLDIDNSHFEITSLVTINEPTTVYDMDVDNSNLYFANNVLTHNKGGGGLTPAPPY